MSHKGIRLLAVGALALATGLTLSVAAQANAEPAPAVHSASSLRNASLPDYVHGCATPTAALAACEVLVRTDVKATASLPAGFAPAGYGPAQLQSAYDLPSAADGKNQTIGIVDAFNDPNAASDLATYRSEFGLPACTTAGGCFTRVSQTGSTTSLPKTNGDWALEESLDIDMASAICPNCHIILVEATNQTLGDLARSVNEAVKLGATVVSNSYIFADASDVTWGTYYDHPGIPITAGSGDSGYGIGYPSSSAFVVSVGGTSLSQASNSRGWTETAWSGAGAGCSAFNAQPTGQAAVGTGCSKRADSDVSADADPNTGVALYDSTAFDGSKGWEEVGGTSVATPIIAAVFALAANASGNMVNYPYAHASDLFDVTKGSDGSCSPTQLCTARKGWDGPTGLGTPDGIGAF